MATKKSSEVRSGGKKVETTLAPTLYARLEKKRAKANTSFAQILRDLVQAFVKR